MEQANAFLSDPEQSTTPFESDTQKIVRRHLEDPNHVITEEELKNIRIGMIPPVTEQKSHSDNEMDITSETPTE
jgi:hypothetical protein